LEDSFNSSIDYAKEADKESFGDTFRSLQFKNGSLSRREISDALKAAK
jgi:hypothetical protein